MTQGPVGVTIHDNAGLHQNENVGVHQITENSGEHQNANTQSPHNDHNDPKNDLNIKTENTIDVTVNENEAEDEDKNGAENEDKDEHEELEEAPTKNDSADAERNDATDPDTVSNTMDKKYCARTRTNMQARKQKSYLPQKIRIHPTINIKRLKILTTNYMVQTMGNTHLDLRDYARLHVTIHCGPNQHDNVIRNPLITTILTQYHVSKELHVFGDSGVDTVMKELKQLHARMLMGQKKADKMTMSKKRQLSNIYCFGSIRDAGK